MLSMLCLVVVFGAHSLIDWTWYVPGDACVALLCAGWLAGRGELVAAPGEAALPATPPRAISSPRAPISGTRMAIAGAVVLAALLATWSQWQPQRSEEASQQADALLQAHDPRAASAAANTAVARDPLSVEALFTLASVQQASGQPALARATLERAVRLQPSNPQTWLALGRYDARRATQRRPSRSCRRRSTSTPSRSPPKRSPRGAARSDRNPERLHPGAAGIRTAGDVGAPANAATAARGDRPRAAPEPQKRERIACASSSRRAPGGPRRSALESPRSRSRRAGAVSVSRL